MVSLALRWSRTAEIDHKDDKELFAEIDLYLGYGIVSAVAIKLVIALARLCRKVQDGEEQKAVVDYLNRRLQIAMIYYPAVGRDLLKIVAEKVIADQKHLDQRLALRHASAKALRK